MSLIRSELKIRLLKGMDSIVGKQIANLLPPPILSLDTPIRSILLIRPGGIGDALLLAPAINSLRRHYPDAVISILAERRNGGAFALIPATGKLYLYDRITDLFRLLSSSYDLIIDSEQWHRMSAVIARLVPSGIKIGFDTNERRRLFTHQVPYSHENYEAQSFLNLLKPIGIDESFANCSPFLTIPPSARKEAAQLLSPVNTPFATIFPGASVKERRWGTEKFRQLVTRLHDAGISSVVIGGKVDAASADTIIAGTGGLNLAGRTTLDVTAAVIAESELLISGDSGVLHIGVGVGVRTVSLFGAGIARKWAPQGAGHIVINRNLPCSPCTRFGTTPDCPHGIRCLQEIEVDDVMDAVNQLILRKHHEPENK